MTAQPQTSTGLSPTRQDWRTPLLLLMLMAAAMQLTFASWSTLQYNFAKELIDFDGRDIGIQQSIREIPGFLSFAAVFFLFLFREQTFAMISLVLLGVGAAVAGYFPTFTGFLITTFISSVGFHYYETMHQSLSLQWLKKKTAAAEMGKILSVSGFAQLACFAMIFLVGQWFDLSYTTMFLIAGGSTLLMVVAMVILFPVFPETSQQKKKLVLKKRYWLYYALTFVGGARRQILLVFAAWMMIERFGYEFHDIAALFFINAAVLMVAAPYVGKLIVAIGERQALRLEYVGLALVFTAYAYVDTVWLAVVLYVVDHALFAMAIAMKTYFQKIADPEDIASTAGVAFTINHIAAVFIPVGFGFLWLYSPAAVFLSGTAMAMTSFVLASLIPRNPEKGNEFIWSQSR